MEDEDVDDRGRFIVKAGEAVSVPLLMRDSSWTGHPLEIGVRLRGNFGGNIILPVPSEPRLALESGLGGVTYRGLNA